LMLSVRPQWVTLNSRMFRLLMWSSSDDLRGAGLTLGTLMC
jgi:hypothetical protein